MFFKEKNLQTIEKMTELPDRPTKFRKVSSYPSRLRVGGSGRNKHPYAED